LRTWALWIEKTIYNPLYDANEESVSDMLNDELDIDSDDEMDLEIEVETVSEESGNEMSKSESESETSVVACFWVGDKKTKAYTSTFTKNAGPQFNLLPYAEPMDYFSLFFNDELLNNIVTNRYARDKIAELQLTPRSIWSRWSDVSVSEVKAFLGLIINMWGTR
jgi:hypothetical protein